MYCQSRLRYCYRALSTLCFKDDYNFVVGMGPGWDDIRDTTVT
jgi:hypothetical protein